MHVQPVGWDGLAGRWSSVLNPPAALAWQIHEAAQWSAPLQGGTSRLASVIITIDPTVLHQVNQLRKH